MTAHKDKTSRRSAVQREPASPDKVAVVKLFGQILGNVNLYGLEHRITMNTLENGFERLSGILQKHGKLSITLSDNEFMVDGMPVQDKSPMIGTFRERLRALSAAGFTLSEGVTADEFVRLVIILTSPEEAQDDTSLAEKLREAGAAHIQSRVASVVEVDEDEIVVNKGDVDGEGYGGDAVDQIIAFLRGDQAAGAQSLADIEKAANHTEDLSSLIMQAVDVRRGQANLADGESLGDIVVGCLRRAYEGLCKDKSFKTKKGKKQVAKTLAVMEESLLKKLRDFAGEGSEEIEAAVSGACEEMRQETQTELLVDEYAKKKKALEKSERGILRHLKRQSPESIAKYNVEAKLEAGGLSPTQWHEFLIRSKKAEAAGPGSGIGGEGSVATLAAVLSQLETVIESVGKQGVTEQTSGSIAEAVARVSRIVEESAAQTEDKITALQGLAKEAAEAEERHDIPTRDRNRRSMLAYLGEIAQELRQPLAVISTTIDMLQRVELDEARQAELQMLQLAHKSTERMDRLIAKLTEVVGFPRDLTPDQAIVADLYR